MHVCYIYICMYVCMYVYTHLLPQHGAEKRGLAALGRAQLWQDLRALAAWLPCLKYEQETIVKVKNKTRNKNKYQKNLFFLQRARIVAALSKETKMNETRE